MPQAANPNPNPSYDLHTNTIMQNQTKTTPSLVDTLMQQIQAIQKTNDQHAIGDQQENLFHGGIVPLSI